MSSVMRLSLKLIHTAMSELHPWNNGWGGIIYSLDIIFS